MNKDEFLRQLEQLLSGISEEERADAMAFYRSYFEDAGEANEASILRELESPQKVAESILKNIGAEGSGSRTFGDWAAEHAGKGDYTKERANQENKKNNTAVIVLSVIVAILTAPLWLALLGAAAAVVMAVVVTIFGVAISIVAVMLALLVVGFILLGIGFARLFTGGAAIGLALLGGGLIVLALGLLAVVLTVWIFGVFLPWACRGIWNLCKKPFAKRKERKAA